MKKFTVKIDQKSLIFLAVLLALDLVASKFTVGSTIAKVSPSFLVEVLIGTLGGPFWAALVLAMEDIMGALTSGIAYFPGFTVSALVSGLFYGLFFFRKRLVIKRWQDWVYTFLAMTVIMLLETALLNTLWVTLLMPEATFKTFLAILKVRAVLLLQIPIKTGLIMFLFPVFQRMKSMNKFLL